MVLVKIITGLKNSGKTTEAKKLAEKLKADGYTLAGFISEADGPGKSSYRLVNLFSGEILPAVSSSVSGDAGAGGWEKFDFSRFLFNTGSFRKASFYLMEMIDNNSFERGTAVIIDELGPLELRGGGFLNAAVKLVAANRKTSDHFPLILVIRENLLESMITFLGLEESEIELVYPSQDQ